MRSPPICSCVRLQLCAAQSATRQQSEAHEKAREDMRRSFMRTVCALNVEVRPAGMTLCKCCAAEASSTPLAAQPTSQSPERQLALCDEPLCRSCSCGSNIRWWYCRLWASCNLEATGAMANRRPTAEKGRRTLRAPLYRQTSKAQSSALSGQQCRRGCHQQTAAWSKSQPFGCQHQALVRTASIRCCSSLDCCSDLHPRPLHRRKGSSSGTIQQAMRLLRPDIVIMRNPSGTRAGGMTGICG